MQPAIIAAIVITIVVILTVVFIVVCVSSLPKCVDRWLELEDKYRKKKQAKERVEMEILSEV